MYKIIGTDQKEYGPVTSDQINQWIAQGRVNAQTRAQADGGEWKTLGDFPEFSATLGHRVPPTTSPPLTGSPAKTSGLAIASLVLGILGMFTCGISSVVGLILGIVAMGRVKKSNGALEGHGLALAGTIVSGVFIFMLPLTGAMMLPALETAKQRALTIQCVNNMKQLALAVRIYSGDNNDHFPPAAKWCDSIKSEVGSDRVYKCPAADNNERCNYAYNSRLDGMEEKNIDPDTVLFFEIEGGWNVSGGPELLISRSRHRNIFVVAFADGHVEQMTAARLAKLRWTP
jgi:prepilin-type processing-associated H-X9-DG protein